MSRPTKVAVAVCDHCGCRAFPAIAELTADHELILSLAWELAEARDQGGRDDLLVMLDAHVRKEETGLYPLLLKAGDLWPEDAALLEEEHRALRAALMGDGFDRRDYYALAAHIEQEEMQLFPAAMFAFDDDEWDELEAMRNAPRPAPGRDLDSPEEITEMVRRFYADVAMDDLLGPIFNDVAKVDWPEHLPKLVAFWCRALLGLPGYSGNPFRAHALVHQQQSFGPAHFVRWLTLFHETLEIGWVGPNASRARELADDVARVHGQQLIGQAITIDAAGV